MARFIPHVPRPYCEQDAVDWLETHEPARAAAHRVEFAIADQRTDWIYGAIAAAINQGERSANVGYWLTPTARGHGHATAALRLLSGCLFDALGSDGSR